MDESKKQGKVFEELLDKYLVDFVIVLILKLKGL